MALRWRSLLAVQAWCRRVLHNSPAQRPASPRRAPFRSASQAAFLEPLESRQLLAVVVELVADINSHVSHPPPQNFTVVGNTTYFAASDGRGGHELWKTDGSSSGTILVKDIKPHRDATAPYSSSSSPTQLTNVNGTLFFVANNGTHGAELWKSNGTSTGTVLVKDIRRGSAGSSPAELINVGGVLYFTADDGAHGVELWRSDGASAGTTLVADISPTGSSSPVSLTNVNGTLMFAADNGAAGVELWKSNGASTGTTLVRDINVGPFGSSPGWLVNVGNTLYFRALDATRGFELWKSSGTSAGTTLVRDIRSGANGSSPSELTVVGSTLYFRANDGVAGYELWNSNGSSSGTALVRDVSPGATSSSPTGLANYAGTLLFVGNTSAQGIELWKSNGTSTGTVLVRDIATGAGASYPKELTVVGSSVFFRAASVNTNFELWRTDGTSAGTTLVRDIFPGSDGSVPQGLAAVGTSLYFVANDGATGPDFWKSNGTSTGTVRVKDFSPATEGSNPRELVNVAGTFYLTAEIGPVDPFSAMADRELWKTGGVSSNTALVSDIFAEGESSRPTELTNVNGTLFLSAADSRPSLIDPNAFNHELWKSNGASTGTTLVRNIRANGYGSQPMSLVNVGSTVYFIANNGTQGFELWKSDGSSGGTTLVRDINPGAADGLTPADGQLTVIGSTLYFFANNGTQGFELWKSDGTSSGTALVRDIRPGAASGRVASPLVVVGSTLYFVANDGASGDELWKTNGTSTGTTLVRDVRSGAGDAFGANGASLVNVSGTLFFVANDGTTGFELWKSNGTSTGTTLVRDIRPGTAGGVNSSGAAWLTNVGGALFLVANDGATGFELWTSDGTSAETKLVRDIRPGSSSSLPGELVNVKGVLLFAANDGTTGRELWRSQGSSGNTTLVQDIDPGPGGSAPQALANLGGTLYLAANDGLRGEELWRVRGIATNQNPTANAGGPYTLTEGQSLTLAGSGSDPDGNTLTYSWDLNGDGLFGDATGAAPTLTKSQLTALGIGDGPRSVNIQLRADDGQGGVTTSTAALTVVNAAPTAVASGAGGLRGELRTFQLTASDPGSADQSATFTFNIDWDGNGTIDQTATGAATATAVTRAFTSLGTVQVRVQAVDKDGGASAWFTLPVTTTSFAVRPRAGDAAIQDLHWAGSSGGDVTHFFTSNTNAITIIEQYDANVLVERSAVAESVNGKIVAHGYDGDDVLMAEYVTPQTVELYGGLGDDLLVGGFAADLLDGGDGSDMLLGGTQSSDGGDTLLGGDGRDILVGGFGEDSIVAGAGEDLVVADSLQFGTTSTGAYFGIRAEWNSSRPYATRVANISGTGTGPRNNGNFFVRANQTAFNDQAVDTILGGADLDWVIYRLSQDLFADAIGAEIKTGT